MAAAALGDAPGGMRKSSSGVSASAAAASKPGASGAPGAEPGVVPIKGNKQASVDLGSESSLSRKTGPFVNI